MHDGKLNQTGLSPKGLHWLTQMKRSGVVPSSGKAQFTTPTM